MKSSYVLLCALAVSALAAGCVSTTPATVAAAENAQAAAPQKKTKTVVVRTPVPVKESKFFADGLLDEYTIYTYSPDKSLLLEEKRFDATRPDPVETTTYSYTDGRLAEKKTVDTDAKLRYRHTYLTDTAGRVTSDTSLDAKGRQQSVSLYAYDAAGNRTEWKTIDGSGTILATTRYAYDKGLLVRIDMLDAGGKADGSISIEYDPAGLAVKRSYLDRAGNLEKYETCTYVQGRLAIESAFSASGALSSRTENTWNADGALAKRVTTGPDGTILDSAAYEYAMRETATTVEE